MKGLTVIPHLSDLEEAYQTLQAGNASIKHLAIWSGWVRFDPRLGEQWIAYIQTHWKTILPMELNGCLLKQAWPQAAGPLLSQVSTKSKRGQSERLVFQNWCACVMAHITPAQNELYFIGLRAFAGVAAFKDVTHSLKAYRRWGFYAPDLLVNKATSHANATHLSTSARAQILSELIKVQKKIRVRDYIGALGGAVSPRQAQLDLAARKDLKKNGNTKGCYYSQAVRAVAP